MIKTGKHLIKQILNRYTNRVSRHEYDSQRFLRLNERPVEFGFVFRQLAALCPRTILDVGTGTTALPHLMHNCGALVTATDNVTDYWPAGMLNRHYHVIDDDITATRLTSRFDLVTCVSVLEHIQKPDDAVRNMFSLLAPDGHLVITCPYTERSYVPDVYQLPGSSYGKGSPYVTQSYSRTELDRWLHQSDGEIVEQEFWQYWTGEHWTVGEQQLPPLSSSADAPHQLTCLLLRKVR